MLKEADVQVEGEGVKAEVRNSAHIRKKNKTSKWKNEPCITVVKSVCL